MSGSAQEQMALARQMLSSQGAPMTAENLNRAMLALYQQSDAAGPTASPQFDSAMERVSAPRSGGGVVSARPAAPPVRTNSGAPPELEADMLANQAAIAGGERPALNTPLTRNAYPENPQVTTRTADSGTATASAAPAQARPEPGIGGYSADGTDLLTQAMERMAPERVLQRQVYPANPQINMPTEGPQTYPMAQTVAPPPTVQQISAPQDTAMVGPPSTTPPMPSSAGTSGAVPAPPNVPAPQAPPTSRVQNMTRMITSGNDPGAAALMRTMAGMVGGGVRGAAPVSAVRPSYGPTPMQAGSPPPVGVGFPTNTGGAPLRQTMANRTAKKASSD